MKKRLSNWAFLGLVLFSAANSMSSPLPKSSPEMKSSPGPKPSFSPISPGDAKILLREFSKAQATELKALLHRNQFEIKELKASQDARLKEWKNHESQERHQFFKDHEKGAERREYVGSYLQKQEALVKEFTEEKSRKITETDAKVTQLKEDQAKLLNEVKKLLESGIRPGDQLWPKPGR